MDTMQAKHFTRHLFLTLALFVCSIYNVAAQLEIEPALTSPLTPESLIQEVFAGKGVDITNVRFSGQKEAIGYFKNGLNEVNLSEGFIMTTGQSLLASQANDSNGAGHTNQSTATDATLAAIVNDGDIKDLAIYEIEFIPKYDTIEFRYVFASEEYPEFGCNCFNDVFGFFLQGPDYPDWTNLAVVPGTLADPVSVKTIHPLDPDGSGSGNSSCTTNSTLPDCNPVNEHLYVDNQGGTTLTYDGLTKVLTAKTRVQKCQPYTIKLAIADVGDDLFDSAVFFEANSFGSDVLEVAIATESVDGALIEGCAGGSITFSFDEPVLSDYRVDLNFAGNAIRNSDYDIAPLSDVIPAGEKSLTLNIRALKDDIVEPLDSVGFVVTMNDCEQKTFWMYIKDSQLEGLDLGEDGSVCPGDSTQLMGDLGIDLPEELQFQSTSGNLDINTVDDNGTGPATEPTISTILVEGVEPTVLRAGLIKSVCVQVAHNNVGDIDLILESPSGQLLELSSDNGEGGSNYDMTCFTSDAATSVINENAPFTGDFLPEGSWENLYGGAANGEWKLYVKDDIKGTDGFLLSWSISFNALYDLTYAWLPATGLSCSDCPNPKAAPEGLTEYELSITDSYGCIIRDSIIIKTTNDTVPIAINCIEETQSGITFGWNPTQDVVYEINVDNQGWITPSGSGAHSITNLEEGQTVAVMLRGVGSCINQLGEGECTTFVCFPPDASISGVINLSCHDATDGRIDLVAEDPNIIFVMNGDTILSKTIRGLLADTFQILAIDTFTTCSVVLDTFITVPDSLVLDTFVTVANCGMNDGIAAVIPSGGTAPYTYLWDIAAATDTIKNQSPGTYSVVVTDDMGCTATQSLTILSDDTPDTVGITINCQEVTTNSISFSWIPVAGVSLYEVQIGDREEWTAPSASTSILVPNLGLLETVQIKVRGSGECVAVLDSMSCMTEDCTIPIGEFNVVRSGRCRDYTDGVLSVVSGQDDVIFILDTDTSELGVFENLTAGRYQIEVLDTNTLCNSFIDTLLFNPDQFIITEFAQSENCGQRDGIAAVTPSGGVAPYQILWAGGETTDTINGLISENYEVTVIDDLGCLQDLDLKVNLNIDIFTDLKVDITCPTITNNSLKFVWNEVPTIDFSDYEININDEGWKSPNQGNFAHELTNLGFSEIFDLRVRGNSDCGSAVLGNQICATRTCIPPTVTIGVPKTASCVGEEDGELEIIVNTFPFSFVDTTFYRVVPSGQGDGINVIDFNQITVDTLVAPIGGFVIIGTDTLLATEIAPSVTFKDLAPGDYNIHLMDTTLTCRSSIDYVIEEPDSLSIVTQFEGDITCPGSDDGILVTFGLGGNAPYTHNWNDGARAEEVLNDLAPGTYDLVLSDANGCTATESYVVEEAESTVQDVYKQNIGCGETNTGVVGIVANPSFVYEVNWDNGATSDTISDLSPGSYQAIVTNEVGCIDTVQVNINAVELNLATSITMPLCGKITDATALITATAVVTATGNSEGIYEYEWNDPMDQITDTAFLLTPGEYKVTVTDLSTNCAKIDTIIIDAPEPLVLNLLNTSDETCLGENDGSVVFLAEGGIPNYTVDWGDDSNRTDTGRNDLAGGNYTVTVSDDNGCTETLDFTIAAPDSIRLSFTTDTITCMNPTGTAQVIATGGSGDFAYSWNDATNQTAAIATGLTAAEFQVVVTDEETGCFATEIVSIEQADSISLTVSSLPNLCEGTATGSAEVVVTGGSGNFLYLWDDSLAQETPMAANLAAGDYMVLVLDDQGCEDSIPVTVEDMAVPIEIAFNKQDISCIGDADGSSEVIAEGGSPQYVYEWSTGATSRKVENLKIGMYTLTITDQIGCTSTDTLNIVAPEALAGEVEEKNITCNGMIDGAIEINSTGGTGSVQYSIDGNRFSSDSTFSGLRANRYEIVIRDEKGCIQDLGLATIVEPTELELVTEKQVFLNSNDPINLEVLLVNGQGELSYSWTSDREPASLGCTDCASPKIDPQFGQTYSVTVTDEQGCSIQSSIPVLVKQQRGVFVPTGFSPNTDGINDRLLVHGREGTNVLTFKIFDRWGELVFEKNNFQVNDNDFGWDGVYRGQVLNSGVFTWVAEVQFPDGLREIVKGHSTLVR